MKKLFVFLLFVSTQTFASDADSIEIKNAFTREAPPMAQATASFMLLQNNSDHDILLTSARSDVAQKVELHTHIHDNGVMRMRQVPNIKIPAKGQTLLKPGGLHIMLIGPTQDISKGKQIKQTLLFQDGSSKTITMPVKTLHRMNHHMKH